MAKDKTGKNPPELVENNDQPFEKRPDEPTPDQPAQKAPEGPVPEAAAGNASTANPGPAAREHNALAALIASRGMKWQNSGHVPRLLSDKVWDTEGKPNEAQVIKELDALAKDSPYLIVQRDTAKAVRHVESSDFAWHDPEVAFSLIADRIVWDDKGQPDAGSVNQEMQALAERSPYLIEDPTARHSEPRQTTGDPVGSKRKTYGSRLNEESLRRRFPVAYN